MVPDDDRAVPPCWTLKLALQASRSPGPEALGRGAKAALRLPSGDGLMTAACPDCSRQGNGVAPLRTEERHCLCEADARPVLFEGPKRFGGTDGRGRRDWPEVAAIERAGLVPVHEKHFTMSDDATVLPCGQQPTAAVALARHPHLDPVDNDGSPLATDRLSWKRKHALDELVHREADSRLRPGTWQAVQPAPQRRGQ